MSAPVFLRAITIAYYASQDPNPHYQDAVLVCHETDTVCEAYLVEEAPAVRLTLDVCLNTTEAWIGNSEEAYTVLGCAPDATILVIEIDYNEARTLGEEE